MREDRKNSAITHYNRMKEDYKEEIRDSVSNSTIYRGHLNIQGFRAEQQDIVTDEDSVAACFNHREGRTALLNFASFNNPGGGFLGGSMAQEEALCHASFLCNVLENFMWYYEENRKDPNRGMYYDRAIYSPDIRFFQNDQSITVDVITCAAPNHSVGLNSGKFSKEENTEALDSRIKFILEIATANSAETLILGAFGCGVFKQDAKEVATLFKKWLQEFQCFKKVVFAVPTMNKVSKKNYEAFKQVFE